jgi:hypothetical protein
MSCSFETNVNLCKSRICKMVDSMFPVLFPACDHVQQKEFCKLLICDIFDSTFNVPVEHTVESEILEIKRQMFWTLETKVKMCKSRIYKMLDSMFPEWFPVCESAHVGQKSG